MRVNDKIHGFRVIHVQELPELKATLCRMEYEKNGADLIWLDRADDNKTFAIAFKTIPWDDTGVFHILEHSVLCGSRKYPVKEPFVELLKSSLQTFLNAFTFPDKTVYPVCSRNDQDFLNLIDVYMDAVLHPLSVTEPSAFRQEGWHYELDDSQGTLRCNGVVYNEMKGAFASPDTVLEAEMDRLLFPDNCYSYVSGGHPDHITELTYENYLASHARFYHPSNARIFLDGSVDLDQVLARLDGFLSAYDKLAVDADIPLQAPVCPPEQSCRYEVGPEDAGKNRVILSQGWVLGSYGEQERILGCSVLAQVLCGSNDAPLKKALLERGLAEDVSFQIMDGIQQPYAQLVIRNTAEGDKERIWSAIRETLEKQVRGGLDRQRLTAVLNHLEFITREKDFGSMPRGLAYAFSSLGSWLYGGDPAQGLCQEQVFQSLRARMEEGWFEKLIQTVLLDNPHKARICLLPSDTLGADRQRQEQERLQALKDTWDAQTVENVMEQFRQLQTRQNTPDTPEELSALPVLSLSDIPETVREIPQTVSQVDGAVLLHQPLETDGIIYLDLYFSLADISREQLSQVAFFAKLLGQVATDHWDLSQLRCEIEGNLGQFSAYVVSFAPVDHWEEAHPYLVVSASMLESKKPEALRLLDEVLCHSRFTDGACIRNLLKQTRLSLEKGVLQMGSAYAAQRAAAGFSANSAAIEAIQGIDQLRWLQRTERTFDRPETDLCGQMAGLCRTLFARERVTVSVTGPCDREWLSAVWRMLPSVPMGEPVVLLPTPVRWEGFQIPSEVGFAAKAANLHSVHADYSGVAALSTQVLTYGYLWNTIRVQGGAYGTGLSIRAGGDLAITSYRDPSAGQSLVRFSQVGEALRTFCGSGEPLDRYIISTVGEMDPLLTLRMQGVRAAGLYFTRQTPELRRQVRSQLLHATAEELCRFSQVLDAACAAAGACVIGGRQLLEACGKELDTIEPLV